jgi:6-phosphogluconolactonase/glucosamine-6-phosphate isomerase/deaminase
MRSSITENPDKEAGEYISSVLKEHAQEDILLLLSGGSAFSILMYIKTENIGPNVTIGFVDEHFTADPEGNNFLIFTQTEFYKAAEASGAKFITSVPFTHEKHHEFADRIRQQLEDYIDAHPSSFKFAVFGIGEDGHTAGIFPSSSEEFTRIYQIDEAYTYVTQTAHKYAERTTITPTFIEEMLDEVILYAIGKNKCDNILNYMYNQTFTKHEIPALIPASHPHSMLFTDCPTIDP